LHLAATVGKVEICKFLIKDLKVDVDTTGSVGKILLFSALVVWLAHFVHPLGHPQSVGEIAS